MAKILNKNISLFFIAIILILGIGVSFLGCTKSKKEISELRIGMELQYPPFETTDTKGNPSGISVDIARALGKYLKQDVKIIDTAWTGLIPSLQSGSIDLILSSMTITEERDKTIDFSIPYARSNLVLLVAKDSPIKKFQDLNAPGRVLAVKLGTTGEIAAKGYLTKGKIHVFDEVATAVLEVAQKKADAFIYDELTVYKNWKKNEKTTRMILTPIKGIEVQYWGMGIKEGRNQLREQINSFIRSFRQKGGFNKIADKYLGDLKTLFAEKGVPFFFDLKE